MVFGQSNYLSQEDALVQWKGEESSGKVSVGWHGNEKVRIVVSESSEGREVDSIRKILWAVLYAHCTVTY